MDKPPKNDIMRGSYQKKKGCVMKKDNRQIMNALMLVFQFGINMIVPIFLCCLLGIWIGEKTGISWMMIPFFFVGALAGFSNIYKMARKLFEKDSKDDKHVKKN